MAEKQCNLLKNGGGMNESVKVTEESLGSITMQAGKAAKISKTFTPPDAGYVIGALTPISNYNWVKVTVNYITVATHWCEFDALNGASSQTTCTPTVRIVWVKA